MHPILFEFNMPEFLQGILADKITIYTYGALIALGALLASFYTAMRAKKELGVPYHVTNNLVLLILISAFVGGKLFFYFENPTYYFGQPANMIKDPGKGFVFYGSLIFSVAAIIIFFRINKIPIPKMLDIIAITTCIVHFFGRLGCFNAGCCYGHVHDGIFSVAFTNPVCMAKPLNTPLHPTQLYSAAMILTILVVLVVVKNRKSFDGQVFLLYLMLYAIGRSIVEIFRGDLVRGFIVEDYLSHSQFIAAILFFIAVFFYLKLRKSLPGKGENT